MAIDMELTPVQRDILTAMINIYRKENRAVRGEEVAGLIDRNPGTVKNQMQSLKALNLIEGVPGPKGGYKTTGKALEALSHDETGEMVVVPIVKNGIIVDGVTASEIVFNKVMKTHECGGTVRIIGDIKGFNIGDEIRIGPTPVNKLYICAEVLGRDDTMSRLIFHVKEMISVPRSSVKSIAKRAIHIDPNITIKEAAKILAKEGVLEALVDCNPPGLISINDIVKTAVDSHVDIKVGEIVSYGFPTIKSDELIFEAVKIFGKSGPSLLVVIDNGVSWGFITPRDIVRSLSPT
jgi:predicted transcriptional regulator